MAKCLVTGHKGYIGAKLYDTLKSQGHSVLGIDLLDSEDPINLVEELAEDSRGNIESKFFDFGPEYVFHLAGDASNVGSPIDKYNANIIGTENILKAIIETNCPVRKVIIASSASVYGDSQQECRETFSPEPVSHYGISKLGAEKIAQYYFNKIPIVITRPFNYTGPGQDERFLIPKIIKHFNNFIFQSFLSSALAASSSFFSSAGA